MSAVPWEWDERQSKIGGVIWRVEGRVSLDAQEMEETNERCSRHGARRGDFGGISGASDCGEMLMGDSSGVM
jgi:hypothetical protein